MPNINSSIILHAAKIQAINQITYLPRETVNKNQASKTILSIFHSIIKIANTDNKFQDVFSLILLYFYHNKICGLCKMT